MFKGGKCRTFRHFTSEFRMPTDKVIENRVLRGIFGRKGKGTTGS
jgi:hypothetical protein